MTTGRLTLSLDIRANDIGVKKVNVRSSLMVANFVSEIKDKFNLDGNLQLQLGDGGEILNPENALDLAGAGEGSLLLCTRVMESTGTLDAIQRGMREPFGDRFQRVYLSEDRTMTEYDRLAASDRRTKGLQRSVEQPTAGCRSGRDRGPADGIAPSCLCHDGTRVVLPRDDPGPQSDLSRRGAVGTRDQVSTFCRLFDPGGPCLTDLPHHQLTRHLGRQTQTLPETCSLRERFRLRRRLRGDDQLSLGGSQ